MRAGARRIRAIAILALLVCASGLGAGEAAAESDGMLDPYFGNGGLVRTVVFPPGPTEGTLDVATAVAIQPDGKVVAGLESYDDDYEFVVARYMPDGSLDMSFGGGDGLATVEASGDIGLGDPRDDRVADIALQADGKIVAVGSLEPPDPEEETSTLPERFGLLRLNPDGSPDASFGIGGIVSTDLDGASRAQAVAIQPDGKIVAGGQMNKGNQDFALVRYLPDGLLDPAFSGDGKLVANMSRWKDGLSDDAVEAVAIAPDGDLIAAGNARIENYDYEVVVTRYRGDGTLETGFGTKGIARIDLTDGSDVIGDVALLADGQMRLPLRMPGSGPARCDMIGVLALTANGVPASGFGTGGHVAIDTHPNHCEEAANAIAVQPNGKIIIGGGNWTEFTMMRFTPEGVLDPSFAAGAGLLNLPVDSAEPYIVSEASTIHDLALDGADRIVAVGASKPGGVWTQATLARFTDPCTVAAQTAQISAARVGPAQSRLRHAQAAQRKVAARMRIVRLTGPAREALRKMIGKELRRAKRKTADRRRALKRARQEALNDERAMALACGLPSVAPSQCPKAKAALRRHRGAVRKMKNQVAKFDRRAPGLRAKLKKRRAKLAKARRSVRKHCPGAGGGRRT